MTRLKPIQRMPEPEEPKPTYIDSHGNVLEGLPEQQPLTHPAPLETLPELPAWVSWEWLQALPLSYRGNTVRQWAHYRAVEQARRDTESFSTLHHLIALGPPAPQLPVVPLDTVITVTARTIRAYGRPAALGAVFALGLVAGIYTARAHRRGA